MGIALNLAVIAVLKSPIVWGGFHTHLASDKPQKVSIWEGGNRVRVAPT